MNFNPKEIKLKVGLEIHQQLATKGKLFCDCHKIEEPFKVEFMRRLRPTQSEMGEVDPAAMFEFKKGTYIVYKAGKKSSCLVEMDEEPPHDLNPEAIEHAIIIALALQSDIVDEIQVMRKIVIDGSNTTGFQRTAIVALGGKLRTKIGEVKVQTVTLEEDAARILGQGEGYREYALDRLGIPLIEVALEPLTATPQEIQDVALSLGRLMRSTGKVARGLGTIRQDLNISVMNGKPVEVKGVQKLDLLQKVIEYEAIRQLGLIKIKEELEKRGIKKEDFNYEIKEITEVFKDTKSKILKRAIEKGWKVFGIKISKFKGIFGFEPFKGIRLGREIAEMVSFYGIRGIFHCDELPAYEITEDEVKKVRDVLNVNDEDGFVIIAGSEFGLNEALNAIVERCLQAFDGVPAETRAPTHDGKTRYSRPRPGAARMYPETDIPTIPISREYVESLRSKIGPSWEEQISSLIKKYKLSEVLAVKLYDSPYLEVFEKIVKDTNVSPTFVAATLTETIVSLLREGFDESVLNDKILFELFSVVDSGKVSKEAIPNILEVLMKKEAKNVEEAIKRLGIKGLSREELVSIIEDIVNKNVNIIRERGLGSFGPLMGKVMQKVRGRSDGKLVAEILKEKIKKVSKG
jgi:glutamyl-tRNA(Gln) amidotransferase subunit E